MITPEQRQRLLELARAHADSAWPPGQEVAAMPIHLLAADVRMLLRMLEEERERAVQTVIAVANDMPASSSDAFRHGFKQAIHQAIAAIRRSS